MKRESGAKPERARRCDSGPAATQGTYAALCATVCIAGGKAAASAEKSEDLPENRCGGVCTGQSCGGSAAGISEEKRCPTLYLRG